MPTLLALLTYSLHDHWPLQIFRVSNALLFLAASIVLRRPTVDVRKTASFFFRLVALTYVIVFLAPYL